VVPVEFRIGQERIILIDDRWVDDLEHEDALAGVRRLDVGDARLLQAVCVVVHVASAKPERGVPAAASSGQA
jgi:hypothetical protein